MPAVGGRTSTSAIGGRDTLIRVLVLLGEKIRGGADRWMGIRDGDDYRMRGTLMRELATDTGASRWNHVVDETR